MTQATSQRTQAPASQSSANTGWNILYTPGGSPFIEENPVKSNLLRVLGNKEYRIYGAYLTGVTAVRSAVEIIPAVGKLLLNTATWFVDVTSSREDGIKIVARDLANVIHSVKTTIALPFFAIAGLIFPSEVFGLFENMPGVQTKVAIIDERAALAKIQADRVKEEGNLAADIRDLAKVRQVLKKTNDARTATKAELDDVLQQIERSKGAAAEAARLNTEVNELAATVAGLRRDEETAQANLTRILDEIATLEPELETAKGSNASVLEGLASQRTAEEESLRSIKNQTTQASAKLTATQTELDALRTTLTDLTRKATELQVTFDGLNAVIPGLVAREADLRGTIQGHENTLKALAKQVDDATEKTRSDLAELKNQIASQQAALDERKAAIEALRREQEIVLAKRSELSNQRTDLEVRILPDLTIQQRTREATIAALDNRTAALGDEIAAKQTALQTAESAAIAADARLEALHTTIAGLVQSQTNFQDNILPGLERTSIEIKQKNDALEEKISAKRTELNDVTEAHAAKSRELEAVQRDLTARLGEQASLEQTLSRIQLALQGSSATGSSGASSSDTSQAVSQLNEQLKQLGASIADKATQETTLKTAIDQKTQAVTRLTAESSSFETKVKELEAQEKEINERLPKLNEEIAKLEARENTLREQTNTLEGRVQTANASLTQIKNQHTELVAHVAKVGKEKETADAALKDVSEQVTALLNEKGALIKEIERLKPSYEEMNTTLAASKAEKANLDEVLINLRTEKQALTQQIDAANQQLRELKETLASTEKAHAGEIQRFEEAKTQLTDTNSRLAGEIQTKQAARDEIQAELQRLTASVATLTDRETALQASVRAAEAAEQAVNERTTKQEAARLKAQTQTEALSAQVQTLTQELANKAAAIREQEAGFEAREADFDTKLRQKETDSAAAFEHRRKNIESTSPAKSIRDTSIPETIEEAAEELATTNLKLRKCNKELERGEKALAEMRQISAQLKKKNEADLARLKGEAAAARTERDRLNVQIGELQEKAKKLERLIAVATPAKQPAGATGSADTPAK